MEASPNDPSGLDGIPSAALDRETTPYDYIVVGSGAGGGPLAARLARSGMKVLVLEAGVDPGAPLPKPDTDLAARRAAENEHLIYHCPGLHAASTEPHLYTQDPAAQTSWGFDVSHYSDPASKPPSHFYPRASAVGGCTAHHAMIAVYGGDSDWQKIADLTGDDSWAPGKMRAIYKRIERAHCSVIGGRIGYFIEWLKNLIDPGRNAGAERGEGGWLDISVTDPKLAMNDRELLGLLTKTVIDEEGLSSGAALWRWIKRAFSGMLFRDLDLNDERTMRESPEGVALVPLAVNRDGVRRGPREWLLETRRELQAATDPFAGRLDIATGILARRVLFELKKEGEKEAVPCAIGVEFEEGRQLYGACASPLPAVPREKYPACFARREIILCGGAFNTPQLLMLSGIGCEQHLRTSGVQGLAEASGATGGRFVNLPGVGQNLLDRCEISVISEMKRDFCSLKGVDFDPNSTTDPALNAWKAEGTSAPRSGIYTTGGAALAIVKRSRPDKVQPDLLMFGFPVAFRGYYRRWSQQLLARAKDDPEKYRNLWSWVILKAYSINCGSVRLKSDQPTAVPAINFRYFGDCWNSAKNQWNIDEKDDDLEALKAAVTFVRGLNRHASKLIKAELQPGPELPDGSNELRDWIVRETWGHHASGTCRIGADPWRENPADIQDKGAVLDSKFRVHGVRGLRVVDASVFPKIPGYFIVVPIYMISEKAADTILDELPL